MHTTMVPPPTQRYRPSNMTQALGLEAYDFRHHGDSDDDGSGGSRSADSSNGDDNNHDDKDVDSDDETQFDEQQEDNGNSRGSSLRNSTDTNGMDTVMTGDHVNALLKVYEGEESSRRWRESAHDNDNVRKLTIIQRRRSKDKDAELHYSLETNSEYAADMLDVDDDEAEDDVENNIGEINMKKRRGGGYGSGPMGGNKDDHPVLFNKSCSDATATIDNRTMKKLLFMDDEHEEEDDEDSSPKRYRNLRGSLTSLKDNLAGKATMLADFAGASAVSKEDPSPTVDGDDAPKRPIHRKASNENHALQLPINFNDGKRPKTRRGTIESESMWTAAPGDYNRRGSNGSSKSGFSSWTDNRRGSNDSQLSQPNDRHIDEENGEQQQERSDSWIGLETIRGSLFNQKESVTPFTRRASKTPFIDDDGNLHHSMQRGRGQFYRPGQRTIQRCIGVLFAIAVTVLSSALIGFAVQKSDGKVHEAYVPIPPSDDTSLQEAVDTISEHGHYSQDDLFQMAKNVDDHCHSEQLSTEAGRWECQQICHDHFCCFDIDIEDVDSGYNCRNDESKLCRIFAGCEILILDDFVSGAPTVGIGGAVKEKVQGGSSYGDATGEDIVQEIIEEDNLGWQEIRQKYINVYCEESNVKTKVGRKQCVKVCENHFCCFDTTEDGTNCQNDKSMTCDAYSACQVILVGLFDHVEQKPAAGLPIPDDITEMLMPPGMAGDYLLPPPLEGDLELPTDPILGEMGDNAAAVQYTSQELLEIKADITQRCSDHRTPIGKLQCEKGCKFHLCCFDSSDDGCQDNPAKLCNLYDGCKVLMGSSLWFEDKKKEETLPQVILVSLEQETEGSDDEFINDYGNGAATVEENSKGENAGDGKDKEQAITAAAQTTSAPKTSKPTLRPTPEPTPKPITSKPQKPVLPPTPPPIAPEQTISTVKLPAPPPVRCIPEGDDEVNTEIYSDDWNDDRYDRCKRWEKKHGMTISEYWDLHGIDSTLEMNILENMLIMDTGNTEAAAKEASLEEEESLDDLDDGIIEDEDEFGEDDLFDNFGEDEYEFLNRLRRFLL